MVDEYPRECLTIEVERSLTAQDVVSTLEYFCELRDDPAFIRSDDGPEFIGEAVRTWLSSREAKTPYIALESTYENAYCKTLNSRPRDELLNLEMFETLKEAMVPVEDHRLNNNHRGPHSWLGYQTLAEFVAAQIPPEPA